MTPTEECLRIEAFKTLWDRDKSKKKDKAISEFSYIEFKNSFLDTNPYAEYADDIKEAKIKEDVFGNINYDIDELIQQAEKKYIEFRDTASASVRFYMANLTAIEKMTRFLNNVDLSERTKNGSPVYKPADISRAMKEASDVLNSLQKLKERVQREYYESAKVKGDKKINTFER